MYVDAFKQAVELLKIDFTLEEKKLVEAMCKDLFFRQS
jgi:hypothetical protein